MSKLVTIFGGSGFVGRYIARRLAQDGWRIRVAVRNPNEALFLRPYGVVGQVVPVFCNIRDDNSVREATRGADAVVNCVGVLSEIGANTFSAVQTEGAERIARIAKEENVGTLVHLSAIGADAESSSEYAQTKAAGEAGILEHFPDAMILRPSLIFGPEDQLFNRFASMSLMGPALPLVGAETKFQPVYVDDVAAAAVMGVEGKATGTYELGGPDVDTFRELMQQMLGMIHRRKMIVNLPFGIAKIMAAVFGAITFATAGLFRGPITRDQVENLRHDNVVSEDAKGFKELGIVPESLEAILPEYLWRFRPSGQYDAIKESARNLRGGRYS
ncbi:complex I NDUFA9 subunit family protein [Pelagovum pacificum]|uniref:Complex I NDUFA9 subunit family protein n=1 Tax=Pelagovum pacificum TaxID=2588711 RepID=A0A5C5GIB9_9RHOB|nr:complex I NDUFA9 subunit family protein [Pelagovum pacificum]QQA42880.1 complex I NDUFA9 subunit family protein [Pelagovum pacificum]TNY33974.1 complex I NDUFA9 subunit family protein [Pelagovum pacificum]